MPKARMFPASPDLNDKSKFELFLPYVRQPIAPRDPVRIMIYNTTNALNIAAEVQSIDDRGIRVVGTVRDSLNFDGLVRLQFDAVYLPPGGQPVYYPIKDDVYVYGYRQLASTNVSAVAQREVLFAKTAAAPAYYKATTYVKVPNSFQITPTRERVAATFLGSFQEIEVVSAVSSSNADTTTVRLELSYGGPPIKRLFTLQTEPDFKSVPIPILSMSVVSDSYELIEDVVNVEFID